MQVYLPQGGDTHKVEVSSVTLSMHAIGLGISEAHQIFNTVLVVVLASLLITGFTARKMAKVTLATPSVSKKS